MGKYPQKVTGKIIIDVHAHHLWDVSAIAALDAAIIKQEQHGKDATVIGLNAASLRMNECAAGNVQAGY